MLSLASVLRSSSRYSALLLLFMMPTAYSVCTSCFGKEPSCKDAGYDQCPWQSSVAANAAALIAVGATTLLSVAMTLPPRILRVFTPNALSALVALHRRPKEGKTFDLAKADMKTMVDGVTSYQCSKQMAVVEIASRLQALDPTKDDYQNKSTGLTAILDVLKHLTDSTGTPIKAAGEGALSYILAKLSAVTCGTSSRSFDLNVHAFECHEASSPNHAARFAASLVRPKSMAQAAALLNHFCLVAVATGVASFLSLSPFLDEVFYEPVRAGDLDWPTAFECLVSYLSLLENNPSKYSLANVVSTLGGMDSVRAAALGRAQGIYSAEFFRVPRGEPRDVDDKDYTKNGKKFNGTITDFNHSSKKGCAAHNYGSPHLAKHVKAGMCLFYHGCNQFVTDKGPGGQCLSTKHVRGPDCDYDPAKKCNSPLA